jgi:hypothetical protein
MRGTTAELSELSEMKSDGPFVMAEGICLAESTSPVVVEIAVTCRVYDVSDLASPIAYVVFGVAIMLVWIMRELNDIYQIVHRKIKSIGPLVLCYPNPLEVAGRPVDMPQRMAI